MSATARLEAENAIPLRAPRRLMFLWGLPHGLVPAASVALYFLLDGANWTLLIPFVWTYMAVPALDTIIGEDITSPPETDYEALAADRYYTHVVFATLPMYFISFVAAMYVLGTQTVPLWAAAPFVFAVGLASGQTITLAHELGHRTEKFDRLFANISLALIGMGHFCIEHNRGHHVRVATPEDCSSARMNETVYGFAFRDMTGAAMGAWEHEAKRLKARGKGFFSLENEILQSYALTVVIAAALVAWLGWDVLPFILIHHFFGFLVLSMVNYIEHYGLKREKLPNGKYEPCQPHHSWNANHVVSNILSVNLQRHSDHHANAMRPYQCLRNFPDLPRLPTGYAGCFTLITFPPLWFKVMNPKVREWAGGDESKINWGPEKEAA
ncbi:MAG: alkane 1-monooxygenase [Pseudomonadota bacterium]